jgi:hypothetical protein
MRWKPAGNDVSPRAEESTLLGTVTKQRLVKTITDGDSILHPPLFYFYFDNSDVSHDLAQGHTSLKSQGYTGEMVL